MRIRWTTVAAIPLLVTSLAACGDTTGPEPGELENLFLDFCATDVPVFLAVQNDGDDWQRVMPDGAGTFAFQATEKFGLAIVHQDGSEFSSEYIFATQDDVLPLSGVTCAEQAGTKNLSGTVTSVPLGSAAMISMAGAFDHVTAPSNTFALTDLPAGPLDLIAHREVLGASDVVPDRVIIRRAQDRTNGSTIPVLDFASSEAQDIAQHSFTASGLSSGDDTFYLLSFNTPTTRGHSLSTLVSFTSGAQSLYGIPGSLTQAGDLHELEVFADAGASYRGEIQFYRVPSSRSVSLGPVLSNPVISTAASSPHLRLRAQLPSQSEYGGFVSVFYAQSGRVAAVTATNAFFDGTPGTWDLTIPDLSGLSGFPSGAGLQSGAGTTWFVDAYGGSGGASAFFGSPTDGAVLRFAGRTSTTSATMMARTRGAERQSSPFHRRVRGIGVI